MALVDLRFHLRLSGTAMAKKLDISRTTLWRYEHDRADFSLEFLDQLAALAMDSGRPDIARVFIEPFDNVRRTAERAIA
jgi:transcriptional regulator with XRE-family HTH domain